MKLVVSFLCALLSSSLLLQSVIAIWNPSSFGRFAELPAIVVFASIPVAVLFSIAVPLYWWLERAGRRLTWPLAAVEGIVLGVFVQSVFLVAIGWPLRLPELVAAATGSAIGLVVYAKLQQMPVNAGPLSRPTDSRDDDALRDSGVE